MMIGLFNWVSPSGCLGLPDQVTAVCMYVVLEMVEMRLDRAPTRRDEAGQMDVHKLARQASPLVLCRRSSLPCYPRPAATRRSTTLPCCAPAGPVRLLCWALPFALLGPSLRPGPRFPWSCSMPARRCRGRARVLLVVEGTIRNITTWRLPVEPCSAVCPFPSGT